MAALQMLKDKGVKHMRFMCIIAAPEGVKRLQEAHPDVDIYIGALDDHLNEHKYIVLWALQSFPECVPKIRIHR